MTRWWRCYEGAPFDPKWRVVAANVGGKPGDVWAIASAILDYASRHDGSIVGIDYEELAVGLGYETQYVTDVTVSFVSRRFMSNDAVLSWDDKQYVAPSTKRVREFRERRKANKNNDEKRGNGGETLRETHETDETPQTQIQIQNKEPPISPLKPEITEAVEVWNKMATQCGLPTVQRLHDTRKRMLRDRLAESGMEGWCEAIDKVARSPLCRGMVANKNGAQPWSATFDFVIKPGNFTKLIEGNYDGQIQPRQAYQSSGAAI